MDYHLQLNGQDSGVFPLEELRRRRLGGELSGAELVWREGMPSWVPLDTVLGASQPAPIESHRPQPMPPGAGKPKRNYLLIVGLVIVGLVVAGGTAFLGWALVKVARQARIAINMAQRGGGGDALEVADREIVADARTRTEKEVTERKREFRTRQYLEAYRALGAHTASWDSDALEMIQSWIESNYGAPAHGPSPQKLSDKIAALADCDDPLVLTVAACNSVELMERIRRLDRALSAFEKSPYRAYPRFYATVYLASGLGSESPRIRSLDEQALKYYEQTLTDGSLRPGDEEEMAEIFLLGWGKNFFLRNAAEVCRITDKAKEHRWLALVLRGEEEVKLAWKARGSGYADSVTSEGWKGFFQHLALARTAFTRAWELHPERPMAPSTMISVAMGEEGLNAEEMREWFDRATKAQIDYSPAWVKMRWALRPRWGGSHEAMLALGRQAIKSRRFDTDVPRIFFDVVSDIESESKLERGQHLYDRPDIWPHFKEMYEGYVSHPDQAERIRGWRSSFAVVAYLAKKYDVAREQMEALEWKPQRDRLDGYGVDLSLLPMKVAIATGNSAEVFERAEASYSRGDFAGAREIYTTLSLTTTGLEQSYCQYRLVTIQQEESLARGEWIELLPASDDDPNWDIYESAIRRLPDGAVEVESGPLGHVLYCRTRVGSEFEVTGEFEVVRSSTRDFQAGFLMGTPDLGRNDWYAFRIKRNSVEDDVASFSQGWTPRQVARQVALADDRNAFQFRLTQGKADAWVNGRQVMERVSPVKTLHVHSDCQLGLGAYNDMNETVIRYRNVKVRRLVPGR